jgi:hypothetical protein
MAYLIVKMCLDFNNTLTIPLKHKPKFIMYFK